VTATYMSRFGSSFSVHPLKPSILSLLPSLTTQTPSFSDALSPLSLIAFSFGLSLFALPLSRVGKKFNTYLSSFFDTPLVLGHDIDSDAGEG